MYQRALIFTRSYLPSSERFFLVFWPEEDAVTTVAEGNVVNAEKLKVGESCNVKMGRKTYPGQIAMIGKYTCRCVLHSLVPRPLSEKSKGVWERD